MDWSGRKRPLVTRMLVATLVPVIVVLSFVFLGIYALVRIETENYARESTRNYAEQISVDISAQFSRMESALIITRANLERLDASEPGAAKSADGLLRSMLLAVPGVHNVWFALEPGLFTLHPSREGERFTRSYILRNGKVEEIFDVSDEVLDDAGKSPWFNIPFRTGKAFVESADSYDYGDGDGTVYAGSINQPVYMHGRIVGVIGIDFAYTKLLSGIQTPLVIGKPAPFNLISHKKQLMYSSDHQPHGPVMPEDSELELALNLRKSQAVLSSVPHSLTGEKDIISLSPVYINESAEPVLLYLDLPESFFSERAVTLLRTIFFLSVLGVLLMFSCTALITRSIVKPIKKITDKANAIAEGELEVAFNDLSKGQSKNEVDLLSRAIRKMLMQLRQMNNLKLATIEAELEQKKMREAARTKDRFFAAMSHEIRTPMNAVIGLSDLLLTGSLAEVQRKHVSDIRISSVSLLSLINDMLDTAKMEAGKLELNITDYDFPNLLTSLCSVVEVMAAKKGLRFEVEMGDSLPRYLQGDSDRLRQLLLNILNNAVKYTEKGFVRFRVSAEEAELVFEVSDSGIGIKPEILPVIFEAFSQAPDERVKTIEGTGLGLSIVQMLAMTMGGTIDVESAFGEGSTFRLRLPRLEGEAINTEEDDMADDMPKTWEARALVVDDNEINLSVASSLLEHLGVTCDTALSGQEAVELASKNTYAVRALGGHYSIMPIIALTANAQASARTRFINSGMNDVLAKPIDIGQMRKVLNAWLPDRQAQAEMYPQNVVPLRNSLLRPSA